MRELRPSERQLSLVLFRRSNLVRRAHQTFDIAVRVFGERSIQARDSTPDGNAQFYSLIKLNMKDEKV